MLEGSEKNKQDIFEQFHQFINKFLKNEGREEIEWQKDDNYYFTANVHSNANFRNRPTAIIVMSLIESQFRIRTLPPLLFDMLSSNGATCFAYEANTENIEIISNFLSCIQKEKSTKNESFKKRRKLNPPVESTTNFPLINTFLMIGKLLGLDELELAKIAENESMLMLYANIQISFIGQEFVEGSWGDKFAQNYKALSKENQQKVSTFLTDHFLGLTINEGFLRFRKLYVMRDQLQNIDQPEPVIALPRQALASTTTTTTSTSDATKTMSESATKPAPTEANSISFLYKPLGSPAANATVTPEEEEKEKKNMKRKRS